MFLTVEEAEALVSYRQARLDRAEQMGRPGYLRKCQEKMEDAIWRLRAAEDQVATGLEALISEARAMQEEVTRATVLRDGSDTGSHLIARLADALEGQGDQPDAQTLDVSHEEICGCVLDDCEFKEGWRAAIRAAAKWGSA